MLPSLKAPVPVTGPVQLVVEGRDDEIFFNALLKHLNQERIQVRNCAGIDALEQTLKDLLATSNFREVVLSLGIVVDSDDNPNVNFQKVCDILQRLNLSIPAFPLKVASGEPRVTVMLLPDENTPGMLEDVCLRSVENDPAISCVNEFFRCIESEGLSLPRVMPKAKAQVFLASRLEVGFGVARAAEKDHAYWDWNHSAFDQVKSFLQQITSRPES